MQPQLYRPYLRDELLALFGAEGASPTYWDGQLVVSDRSILLLTTLGPAEHAPHFSQPSQFEFRPQAAYSYRVAEGEMDWMPQPLAEAMGTRREVHLFANEQDVEPYLYLGQLAGGFSYSGSPDYRRQWARFTLEPKLPRQLWLRFGGYPGWRVFLNHRRLLLESGDTETFAACLDEVRSGQDAHLFLTRYEEDSLKLLANETSAYLAYENSEGGSSNSWNPAILEDTEEVELFTCTCGINLEMPRCYAVEREAGLKVLEEYFRTGTLPDRIEWHED